MDRVTAARMFVEAVEQGSLSAAADRLGLSRAMASRYLSGLEDWVGARLLHRTTRRMSLTAAGEEALPLCREMVALADAVGDLAEPDGSPSGTVRVAASAIFAQTCLVDGILEFLKLHPAVSVDMQVSDRPVDLVEDRIDLAIRITDHPEPSLIARRLGTCRSVLCAAPSYCLAWGQPMTAEDLRDHACLTYSRFGGTVWDLTGPDGATSLPVTGRFSTNDSLSLLKAAAAGAGIAILPEFAAGPLVTEGALKIVLPGYRVPDLGIYALYTSRRHMPLARRALIDFLARRFSDF